MKKVIAIIILCGFLTQGILRAETGVPVQKPVSSVTADKNPPAAIPDARDMISVEFNEADIQSVLKILALKGNVNIVASPEVEGTVTMQLKDVPWLSAFETIVKTYGFSYEKKGNIYQILTPDALKARQDESSVLVREVFKLDYASIDQVTAALKKTLSKTASVESIAGTNQLVITDQVSNMEAIKNLISHIDTKMPQVHIETKIVRTTLTQGEQMGINWNPQVQVSGAKRPLTFPFKSAGNDFLTSGTPIGNTASQSSATQTASATTTTS